MTPIFQMIVYIFKALKSICYYIAVYGFHWTVFLLNGLFTPIGFLYDSRKRHWHIEPNITDVIFDPF